MSTRRKRTVEPTPTGKYDHLTDPAPAVTLEAAAIHPQPASIPPSDPPPALPASVAALAEAIRSTKAPASPPTTPVYGRRARGFVQLGLTVSRESKDLLRRAAEEHDVSMSELLDELLRRYLTRS